MGGAQQRWLVLALLAALPVLAQSTTFDDDFESGTILKTDVPPGHWDTITPGAQIGSVAVTGLAAHRGGHGLRMIDLQGGGTGELAGYHLTYFYSPAPANLYLRTWMRVISSNSYHSHLMGLGGSRSFCSVNLEEPGNTFYLEGELGSYLFTSANVSASTGQWHLIEVAAHGVGTASGGLRL